MNKENEVLILNKPVFFLPATLISPTQERKKKPTIINLAQNVREPLQKLSIPGNVSASYPERPKATSILKKSLSVSLVPNTRALSSRLQQTGSNLAELPLQIRFHKDQQTPPVKKFLRLLQHPQSASMSRKYEVVDSSQIHATPLNSLPKHRKSELMLPSKKQKFATLAQLSHSSPQEHVRTKQKTTTKFYYPFKTLAIEKEITAVSHWNKEEKQSYPGETVSASTQQVIFDHSKQQTGLSLILQSSSPESSSQHFQSPPDTVYDELQSSLKEQKSRSTELQFAPRKHETPILEEVTSDHRKQQTGLCPILGEPKSSSSESSFKNLSSQDFMAFLDTLSVSAEQRQTYELSSSSKDQKIRSTELQFASKENETAILEQVTSDHPKQQTGLRPIHREPKSSSPEFSIKNTFSEYYMYLQSTRIEKDVDRLVERLKQFDKFTCVKCSTKFTTQDELLRHEMIYFED